jgi:ribonuclease D
MMIDDSTQLHELLERITIPSKGVCAIDTEADSLHRHKESLCLIQLSAAGENVLIDPLAISDLSPLIDYLCSCEVWMHGADYDMTILKREYARMPKAVWDTQIGARLLGVKKFGLADLIEHWFGVSLCKSSQKADWGKRPLTTKMQEYAVNDVAYLDSLAECIVEELQLKGRYDWFVQSCHAARQKVLDRDESRDEQWRINGSGKLSSRALAYLRELWQWRDVEAEEWDKPCFMVLNNKELIVWAETLANDEEVDLPKHHQRSNRLKRYYEAVARARALSDEECPEKTKIKRRRKDTAFEKIVDNFMDRRNKAAALLDIDPSLIISRSVAELIASNEVTVDESLLPWQKEQLGL